MIASIPQARHVKRKQLQQYLPPSLLRREHKSSASGSTATSQTKRKSDSAAGSASKRIKRASECVSSNITHVEVTRLYDQDDCRNKLEILYKEQDREWSLPDTPRTRASRYKLVNRWKVVESPAKTAKLDCSNDKSNESLVKSDVLIVSVSLTDLSASECVEKDNGFECNEINVNEAVSTAKVVGNENAQNLKSNELKVTESDAEKDVVDEIVSDLKVEEISLPPESGKENASGEGSLRKCKSINLSENATKNTVVDVTESPKDASASKCEDEIGQDSAEKCIPKMLKESWIRCKKPEDLFDVRVAPALESVAKEAANDNATNVAKDAVRNDARVDIRKQNNGNCTEMMTKVDINVICNEHDINEDIFSTPVVNYSKLLVKRTENNVNSNDGDMEDEYVANVPDSKLVVNDPKSACKIEVSPGSLEFTSWSQIKRENGTSPPLESGPNIARQIAGKYEKKNIWNFTESRRANNKGSRISTTDYITGNAIWERIQREKDSISPPVKRENSSNSESSLGNDPEIIDCDLIKVESSVSFDVIGNVKKESANEKVVSVAKKEVGADAPPINLWDYVYVSTEKRSPKMKSESDKSVEVVKEEIIQRPIVRNISTVDLSTVKIEQENYKYGANFRNQKTDYRNKKTRFGKNTSNVFSNNQGNGFNNYNANNVNFHNHVENIPYGKSVNSNNLIDLTADVTPEIDASHNTNNCYPNNHSTYNNSNANFYSNNAGNANDYYNSNNTYGDYNNTYTNFSNAYANGYNNSHNYTYNNSHNSQDSSNQYYNNAYEYNNSNYNSNNAHSNTNNVNNNTVNNQLYFNHVNNYTHNHYNQQ